METSDITAVGQLREHLASAPGQEQYLAWIKNPMTQMMLAAGRELAQPAAPFPPMDGVNVSLALGKSVGAFELLGFFEAPISGSSKREELLANLKPTYGAERILKEGRV